MLFNGRVFFTLIIATFFLNTSFSRVLKVCMEPKGAFPIYVEKGKEGGELPGLYFEMFKLLEEKMKVKFKFKRRPFKRCLLTLKSGRVDIMASVSYKKSRKEFGVYPMNNNKLLGHQRISEGAYYLYSLNNKGTVWDNKTLKSIRGIVGAKEGYSIVKDLRESNIKVKEMKGIEQLLSMLKKSYVKSVALHDSEGDMWLKKSGFENLRKSSVPLKKKNYYLLLSHQFHRGNRGLSQKIWSTVGKIRTSGHYQKIKSKYLEKGRW